MQLGTITSCDLIYPQHGALLPAWNRGSVVYVSLKDVAAGTRLGCTASLLRCAVLILALAADVIQTDANYSSGILDSRTQSARSSGFDVATLQDIFRSRFHVLRLFGFWTWAPIVSMIFVSCVIGGLYAAHSEDRRKLAALLVYLISPVVLVFVYSLWSTPIYINRVFLGSCILLPVAFCAPIAFQVGTPKKLWQLMGF